MRTCDDVREEIARRERANSFNELMLRKSGKSDSIAKIEFGAKYIFQQNAGT